MGKEFEHGEVAFFDLKHGMKVALYSRTNLAWDSKVNEQKPSLTEFSIGYTTCIKQEVDSSMEPVMNTGAKIPKRAQKTFCGGYASYFQDPDGHLWEIAHNPSLLPE